MIIKYNIARDGSLCRTLQNIKTTSIYFYLFFYFPITGPESPYKTFCNENISSNPFKALLHISNFISCLDQILFRNNFCKFVSWKKIASSNIWNRYNNSNSGSESYFHLCIDFLHWQNHHLDLWSYGCIESYIMVPIIMRSLNDIYSQIWVTKSHQRCWNNVHRNKNINNLLKEMSLSSFALLSPSI